MATLTVTARGQVTFRKEVLQHLGIRPGEKIELDLLPGGRGVLKAARQTGTIAGFVGLLAVALPCLCELVWVLLRVYGLQPSDAAAARRALLALLAAANVEVNRPAVDAGLLVLEAGGDFTDGVIAYEGNWLTN